LLDGLLDIAVCFDDALCHLEVKHYELKPLYDLESASTDDFRTKSRLCICGQPDVDLTSPENRIVVEFEDAQLHLDKFGIKGSVFFATGGSEAAICSGLANLGLMIVQSGATLQANGLQIYKEIREIKMGIWVNTGRSCGLEIYGNIRPNAQRFCLCGFLAGEVAARLSAQRSLWSVVLTVATSPDKVVKDKCVFLDHDELVDRVQWKSALAGSHSETFVVKDVESITETLRSYFSEESVPDVVISQTCADLELPVTGEHVVDIDGLTVAEFEAMPLVIKGESKEVRYAGQGYVVIRFLPTIYSFTQNRCAWVEGSAELRLRADAILLQLFKENGVPHVYEKINDKWVLSRLVMPHPFEFAKYDLPMFTPPDLTQEQIAKLHRAPPIEIVIKTFHGGTSKHRYRSMHTSHVRHSHPLWPDRCIEVEAPYPAPLVRFDWRNPLTMKHDPLLKAPDPGAAAACKNFLEELEGFKSQFRSSFQYGVIQEFLECEIAPAAKRLPDEILPEQLAQYFIDVNKARQTALNLYHVMATFLEKCDVVCNDVCLFITEDGTTAYGEISQDCGRFRHFDLGSLDKDVWRSGGSSDHVLEKWQELSRLMERGYSELSSDFARDISIIPPSLLLSRPLPSPLYIGTTNPYKVSEISTIMVHLGMNIVPTAPVDVEEPYFTYLENAREKALVYAQRVGGMVLSDDSGISVRSLSGLPGPRSARFDDFAEIDIEKGIQGGLAGYADSKRSRDDIDKANNQRLLQLMQGKQDRKASFHVAYVVAVPGRILFQTEAESNGTIAHDLCGAGGFGYDPVFIGDDTAGFTYAELDHFRKNLRSHRRRALRKVARFFADMVVSPGHVS
jgi:XTP/dITP diphosphohydrolase